MCLKKKVNIIHKFFLNEYFYELSKQFEKNEDSEEIDFDKSHKSKECEICHYNYFNDGLNLLQKFVIVVIGK